MKVFVVSSDTQSHAVWLITEVLQRGGIDATNWREGAHMKGLLPYDSAGQDWPGNNMPDARSPLMGEQLHWDMQEIRQADVVVYVGPGGVDTWALVGWAIGQGKRVLGITSRSEKAGIVLNMVEFVEDVGTLVMELVNIEKGGSGQ